MDAYHNSQELKFRTPFGAVIAGGVVRLSLQVTAALPPVSCSLLLAQDGLPPEAIPMTGERGGLYTVQVAAPTIGTLLWYSFVLETTDGVFYYGNNEAGLGGLGQRYERDPVPYQITVYTESTAPEWYKNAVVYQIFPDRFKRGADFDMRHHAAQRPAGWRGPRRVLQEQWDDIPFYTKNDRGEVTRWPFFGGTLAGIREELLYIKSLGVSALYLNPIFLASSNHKYDTADYKQLDPGFGDEEGFKTLAHEAQALGIRIILDGVFSHTGADSVYFNKYGNFDAVGACQGERSSYYEWFHFDEFPHKYDSWWGVDDLPKVDKGSPAYRDFIFGAEDSVVAHWLRLGAAGWRLDVADELPDDFIRGIRAAMDRTKQDTVLLGEVWEDASNKVSYGQRREYLLGNALQSTMNYPFREAALGFMKGQVTAGQLAARLWSLCENYPPEAFSAALNLVGSHDRIRVLTVLGDAPGDLAEIEKEQYKLPEDKRWLGGARLRLLSLLQYVLPGVPCVFYGDEAGVQGFEDPYNRQTFPWGREDESLLGHYRLLGLLRRQQAALREGTLTIAGLSNHVLLVRRETAEEELLLLLNRGLFEHETVAVTPAASTVLDLLTSETLETTAGSLSLTLPPLTARLLHSRRVPREQVVLPRAAGCLCALSSVPASGEKLTFGDVCGFIDYLAQAGFRLWQLLPLNPVGKAGSPFYSVSLFALSDLVPAGDEPIDVGDYEAFCEENAFWLDDDALYRVLKEKHNDRPWQAWPQPESRRRNIPALLKEHKTAIEQVKVDQFKRHRGWQATRAYAASRGVLIIGDLPIYAAPDSADVWAHQQVFFLDEKGNPALHAGVPPDYFTPEGQDWGNPLYNWDGAREAVTAFWEHRLRRAMALYDTVRLDHFRSFSAYFAIPDGKPPAAGHWLCGAGPDFFEELRRRLGNLPIIAEDLGVLDTGVTALLAQTGLPGMLVWQFSEDLMVSMSEEACAHRVFYSGTHDNETLAGWCAQRYPQADPAKKSGDILAQLYATKAPWVIMPLQDLLGLGNEARMNTPGTVEGNWQWRAKKAQLTAEKARRLNALAKKWGRA